SGPSGTPISKTTPPTTRQCSSIQARSAQIDSVAHLAADFSVLALRAASPLRDNRVAVCEPQSPGGHDPRLDQHLRILDRDFVEDLVPGAGELLDDAHLVGVEEAAASQPGFIGEPDGVQDERVAIPATDRVSHVSVL